MHKITLCFSIILILSEFFLNCSTANADPSAEFEKAIKNLTSKVEGGCKSDEVFCLAFEQLFEKKDCIQTDNQHCRAILVGLTKQDCLTHFKNENENENLDLCVAVSQSVNYENCDHSWIKTIFIPL